MKAKAVTGKTIKRVNQKRTEMRENYHEVEWHIESIEFTDGTLMTFDTAEGDYDYAVTATVWKGGKQIG